MENYGISLNTLPVFLGGECIIEHIKTLKIRNGDIHIDDKLHLGPVINNKNSINSELTQKGWVDISDHLLNIDGLLAFVGTQTMEYSPILFNTRYHIPLKLIKFRHFNNKTQARIAFSISNPKSSGHRFYNLDNYINIFIFQRVVNLPPNKGYGIHIYDSLGNIKYKDGLKLLNNINKKVLTFHTEKLTVKTTTNIGNNKAILQTSHVIITICSSSFNQWIYSGGVITSYLKSTGEVIFVEADGFTVYGKRHTYPSYAKGGEYRDVVIPADHILYIDIPEN